MSTYCSVTIVGNLARDPEVRNSQDGTKLVNMTVATSERWKDKATGEQKEKAEFHRVVIFNDRIGDVAERYLKRGAKVLVVGTLQTRKWTDKDGAERYSTEVVIGRFKGELTMLDGRKDDAPAAAAPRERTAARQNGGGLALPPPGTSPMGDLSDEIPFAPCWQ